MKSSLPSCAGHVSGRLCHCASASERRQGELRVDGGEGESDIAAGGYFSGGSFRNAIASHFPAIWHRCILRLER